MCDALRSDQRDSHFGQASNESDGGGTLRGRSIGGRDAALVIVQVASVAATATGAGPVKAAGHGGIAVVALGVTVGLVLFGLLLVDAHGAPGGRGRGEVGVGVLDIRVGDDFTEGQLVGFARFLGAPAAG